MNTVTFGEYNSYSDLNLILSSKTIGSPSVKTSTIDLPGSDGELDFTEYFGEPKYSNRTLKFQFTAINPTTPFDSTVKNLLHGQKVKIVLSDDPDVYFYGRISVGDWYVNKGISTIDVECNCEPYRMKKNETVVQVAYGTTDKSNANICPHFKLWPAGTVYTVASEDEIIFKNAKDNATSPGFPISGQTWVTVKFGTCGNYYVGQHDKDGNHLTSVLKTDAVYTFKTVSKAAFLRITLMPAQDSVFPFSYTNLMVYEGQDDRSYIRYSPITELLCDNARKTVVPKITVDKAAALKCNGTTVAMSANTTHSIPEFEFRKGTNKLEIVTADFGTVVKAVYREGDL